MLNEAFLHYQDYISKKRLPSAIYQLTFIDLLYVSNFKGGNASIIEPKSTIQTKLKVYSIELHNIYKAFHKKSIGSLNSNELSQLIQLCCHFVKMTLLGKTKIAGFVRSYASALLAAHLPDVIPILDRRVLNGAQIPHHTNSANQVTNIEIYYPALIQKMWHTLKGKPNKSVREQDREWFIMPMPKKASD